MWTIVVSGARNYSDTAKIEEVLTGLSKKYTNIVLHHGSRPGSDTICAEIGHRLGFTTIGHNLDGRIDHKDTATRSLYLLARNYRMMHSNPDEVLLFHEDVSRSKGTSYIQRVAHERSIKCTLYI